MERLCSIEKVKGKGDLNVLLSRNLLTTVQGLQRYIDRRFSYFKNDKIISEYPIRKEKLKLNISVSVIAAIVSAFVRSADNVSSNEETAIMRFIIQLFSSKQTSEIAFKSFQNHYRTPERSGIEKSIEILQKMIRWLKDV